MAYSLVVVVLALVLFLRYSRQSSASLFTMLVTLRNRMRNAWSQIDVQLKRRHDLIPNLVETAKAISHTNGRRWKP
jgi:LemA protein